MRDLVVPGRLFVGMQENMRMPLHQSGHQSQAWQVHHLCPTFDAQSRTSGLDAVSANTNHPILMKAFAVEDLRWFKNERRGGRVGPNILSPQPQLQTENRNGQ